MLEGIELGGVGVRVDENRVGGGGGGGLLTALRVTTSLGGLVLRVTGNTLSV